MPTPAELAHQVEQLDELEWYDFLDALDEVSRRRRQRPDPFPDPAPGDRDGVAAWVARMHLITDSGVREVHYLPDNSPPDEIRLFEVSDRYPFGGAVEPNEVRLDMEGAGYKLLVADISTPQWEELRLGRLHLPAGWSLRDSTAWGRRR